MHPLRPVRSEQTALREERQRTCVANRIHPVLDSPAQASPAAPNEKDSLACAPSENPRSRSIRMPTVWEKSEVNPKMARSAAVSASPKLNLRRAYSVPCATKPHT
eukprot:scaffold238811_cov31-Tisochrysis_lutea.AAC.6